ncbi:MAG: zinc ribbon domain-containing protein [Chloroflexi bacterium]|nr:zinc ribbon domain-containing protein [Chloroflexota bacterium]
MPAYKHPCPHCSQYILGDSKFCPFCGTRDPFVLRCPSCTHVLESADFRVCPDCGASLKCPDCDVRLKTDWVACVSCGLPLRCPRCREYLAPGSKSCQKCGTPIVCPQCGIAVKPTGLNTCSSCGEHLAPQQSSSAGLAIPN